MAQYLIVHEDGTLIFTEGKNMKEAARPLVPDGETSTIYRLAGPGKQVTATISQIRHIEVSDPT